MKIGSVLFACLVWTSMVAQQSTQAPASQGEVASPVIHVSSQLVVLDVLVRNKKTGAPVDKLDEKDFLVEEDGQAQQITSFSRDLFPLSVVFLFDLTDTVRPVLKPLADGAFEILGHLKPQDQVAVMVFSSHTGLLQDFTTDRALAAAAIAKASSMKSNDGTFIHEDMYEAVEEALRSKPAGRRRVLVWLTDGTANVENSFTQKIIGTEAPARLHTKEEATTKLMQSDVSVAALIERSAATDAVIVAADVTPFALIGGARVGDIDHYAELTGGPVLKTNKTEVAVRLGELIDELRARYTLGYVPSGAKPPGTFCKTEVKLVPATFKARPELRKSNVVVRTRRGYYREAN